METDDNIVGLGNLLMNPSGVGLYNEAIYGSFHKSPGRLVEVGIK